MIRWRRQARPALPSLASRQKRSSSSCHPISIAIAGLAAFGRAPPESKARARFFQEHFLLGRRWAAEHRIAMRETAKAGDDRVMALREVEHAGAGRIAGEPGHQFHAQFLI